MDLTQTITESPCNFNTCAGSVALPAHIGWYWTRNAVLIQHVGLAYHVVDFFQASGLTVADYADVLKEKIREHGYSYGRHFAPHAAASDNFQTGHSIAEEAAARGVFFEIVQRGSIAAGINRVRQLLPQMWIDETQCGEGVRGLENYAYEFSAELQMFSMKPAHSRWSHSADALRTFADGFTPDLDPDTLDHRVHSEFIPLVNAPWRRR